MTETQLKYTVGVSFFEFFSPIFITFNLLYFSYVIFQYTRGWKRFRAQICIWWFIQSVLPLFWELWKTMNWGLCCLVLRFPFVSWNLQSVETSNFGQPLAVGSKEKRGLDLLTFLKLFYFAWVKWKKIKKRSGNLLQMVTVKFFVLNLKFFNFWFEISLNFLNF